MLKASQAILLAIVVPVTICTLSITLTQQVSAANPFPISIDEDADRLFNQAGEAQNNGDFKFATELWSQFLEKHSDDPQAIKARHYSGVCYMTLKDYKKAVAAFKKVTTDGKADALSQLEETYYYLGWCQFSLGQQSEANNASLQDAIKTFDAHIKKFEKGKLLDQAYYLKGEALYFLGRKKDSIKAYQKVVADFKKSTTRPNALYALGVSQFEVQSYEDAESTFDTYLAEFEGDALANDVKLFKFESILQRGIALNKTDKEQAKPLLGTARDGLKELASLESFPKKDEALFNQAISLSQLGDQKQAADLYAETAALTKSTYAVAARLAAGKLYLRIKDLAKAEEWLQKSTQDDASRDEAAHWLCQALLRNKKPEQAITRADEFLQKVKSDEYAVLLKMDRADAMYETPKSKADSIAAYEAIAKEHPNHSQAPQALYNAAFAALEIRKFKQGIKIAQTFLQDHAENSFAPDVKYVRAECYLLTGINDQAETEYKNLLENHKDHPNYRSWTVRYGLALYLQDKYDETLDHLKTAIPNLKNPAEQAEAQFLQGAANFYLKKYAAAIPDLEKAIGFDKQLKQLDEALMLIGQAYAENKQIDKAVQSLQTLVDQHPNSRFQAQANYFCGQYLTEKKDLKGAITKFDAVLAMEKNSYTAYAHYKKGWALMNKSQASPEDLQKAVEEFTSIIKDEADEHSLKPDSFYSRAVGKRKLAKNEAAIEDIDQCLQLKPDFSNLVSALYEKGMAQSAAKKTSGTIETFSRLVKEFSNNKDADEFRYQLAWAYRTDSNEKAAVEQFKMLTEKHAESPLAAESHFHVAESFYKDGEFDKAIPEYTNALKTSKQAEISEKAQYKIAWSKYQQKKFDEAVEAFRTQSEKYSKGKLADSSKFMVAECFYQKKDFKKAFEEFAEIKDLVLQSNNTNETEKAMTCLHAAESANKTRKFNEALAYTKTLQSELKDKLFSAETWLQIGIANRGLRKPQVAIAAFENANRASTSETGAHAGFLIGEVLFDQKKFEEAIRQYKLVIYGFGGSRASAPIKKWQCGSGYEVARCYHVRIKDETNATKRNELVAEASKFYEYVVKNHPGDKLAKESKTQLEILANLK